MSANPNPYAPPPPIDSPPVLPPGTKQFAPCPACGNVYAKPVTFTWWGGMLGPRMFTHVKCARCSTAYNGKTGQSNDTKIAIYFLVTAVIGIVLGLLVAFA